eukprot:TRINITY_DN7909_c0_g1_i1.p1 TRINITY_DN7909_c0_g1~~TRINITY_DN7909_c0_g1_i1.p1  ORF type:complete len:219 (+),score=9.26 TRINITY_DN7909_c0_g1_i1:116-772(+)
MESSTLPSLIVFVILGCLTQAQATVCPTDPTVDLCKAAINSKSNVGFPTDPNTNGCCPSSDPDCCEIGGYCHISESDFPCCFKNETICSLPDAQCFPVKDLCNGACCGSPGGDGPGLCCGKTCCKYTTSKCRSRKCADVCRRTVNGMVKTTVCKEPKFCCKGYCVDPVNGNPNLPCKGLCCNIPNGIDGFPFSPVKTGVCCNNQCCVDEQKCIRGKCV